MTIQEVSPDFLSFIFGAIMFLMGIVISFLKNNLLAFLFFMCGLFLMFYALILFVIKICKKLGKSKKSK